MLDALKALFRSRKFLLGLVGIIQTIVFHFFPNVDPGLWQAIDAILLFMIGTIAAEDYAAKRAGGVG